MNELQASEKNRETLQPMRLDWIERIFNRMTELYGSKFMDMWKSLDPDDLKTAWAEDLAGYTGEEIKAGLESCKAKKFPPTLPEFMLLCRPDNAETAFYEAVQQIPKRHTGDDRWSHPAVYWAAVKIGEHDLMNGTWNSLKTRWTEAYRTIMSLGFWAEIPPKLEALPDIGKTTPDRETARKMTDSMAKTLKPEGKNDHRAWAKKILSDPKSYPDISVKYAKEAMKTETAQDSI